MARYVRYTSTLGFSLDVACALRGLPVELPPAAPPPVAPPLFCCLGGWPASAVGAASAACTISAHLVQMARNVSQSRWNTMQPSWLSR